ncbi:hypothetical protein LCGC14_0388860 [marine sediment metagenome]|uniref:DksA C4-type domain-containing protein n=1 Tax=marine sediment metagenome TaxID=412755 RepID=A0A0F9T619_9ZZZZ
MNAQRRKEIEKVLNILEGLHMEVEAIKSDEEEVFENIPESLHGTDAHLKSESAVYSLGEAETYLMETIEQLNSATE